jgi:diaminobutyrate-2-oxoglutarate transaminase
MTLPRDVAVFEALESEVRLYCRAFPAVFNRAKGAELFTEDGRTFIDFFCAAGSLNFGHNHEAIKRRLLGYVLDDGISQGLDLFTTAKRDFLVRLRDVVLAPRGLDLKVQLCGPTGTDAVEAALKLARKATGRPGVVAFSGAYHGMSRGSLSVTGSRGARAAGGVGPSGVTFVPFEDGPGGAFDSIGYLERMFADQASGVDLPGAVIVEPVQMEGGVYPASGSWLRALRELTERHGVLLIVDEIQSGCGRTGRFFCFEHAGIEPDIVTLSKSLSGYGLPLSVVLLRRGLDVWAPGEHTGTFRGNQLAFVAATAALELWAQPEVQTTLAATVERLARFAAGLREGEDAVAVRECGAVLGIDLGDPLRAELVQRQCFDNGLIVELCGREDTVLKVMPPLTIDAATTDRGLSILLDAVRVGSGQAAAGAGSRAARPAAVRAAGTR